MGTSLCRTLSPLSLSPFLALSQSYGGVVGIYTCSHVYSVNERKGEKEEMGKITKENGVGEESVWWGD